MRRYDQGAVMVSGNFRTSEASMAKARVISKGKNQTFVRFDKLLWPVVGRVGSRSQAAHYIGSGTSKACTAL